ncbi:MAG: hypothetical protein WCA08_22035 [Desulfoferrobacter sp.]
MKVGYLIDTDWIIHYLIGTEHIQRELKQLRPEGLAVSIISLAEVTKEFITPKILQPVGRALKIS